MASGDLLFLTILLIYVIVLLGFLACLPLIPRGWRIVVYSVLSAAHLFAGYAFHVLRFMSRNIASGQHAQNFFTALQQQLSSGTLNEEYLELPGWTSSVLLSLLAVTAIIGGGFVLWRKIRWYSWPLLIGSFILSFFLFEVFNRSDDRQDIREYNGLRRRVYALIGQKRTQRMSNKQMADAIAADLKNFQYSYESRTEEKESVELILSALRDLTPEEKPKISPPGKN